jgi:uncharacterized lipoprotein YmbA
VKPTAVAVALVLATGQSACLFRARPDAFRYYTLASSAEPAVKSASGLTVGLGPVTLPGYLSRPGLVTRMGDTQVHYAEGDLWAEPLAKQFTRTLSEDLPVRRRGLLQRGYHLPVLMMERRRDPRRARPRLELFASKAIPAVR